MATGDIQIALLDEASSLSLWKGTWQGRERVFLTPASLAIDGDVIRLSFDDSVLVRRGEPLARPFGETNGRATQRVALTETNLNVAFFPSPGQVSLGGKMLHGIRNGVFTQFDLGRAARPSGCVSSVAFEQLQSPVRCAQSRWARFDCGSPKNRAMPILRRQRSGGSGCCATSI